MFCFHLPQGKFDKKRLYTFTFRSLFQNQWAILNIWGKL